MEYFGISKGLKVHSLKRELLVGACFSSDIVIDNGEASQESFKLLQKDDLLIINLINDEILVKLKDKSVLLTEFKEYSFKLSEVKSIIFSGEKFRLKKPIKKIKDHKFNFTAPYLFSLILLAISIFISADFLPRNFEIDQGNIILMIIVASILIFEESTKLLSLPKINNERKVKLFNFILFSGISLILLPVVSIINIHMNNGIGILESVVISFLLSLLSIYISKKYRQNAYQKFINFLLVFLLTLLVFGSTFQGKKFKTIQYIEEKHLFIQSDFNIEEKFKAYENEFNKKS